MSATLYISPVTGLALFVDTQTINISLLTELNLELQSGSSPLK
jgi:hypothetical protein